jgi:hexosaminidase
MEIHSGNFKFTPHTVIIAGIKEKHEAEMLNLFLKKLYGFSLPVKAKSTAKEPNTILLSLLKSDTAKAAYNLEVTSNKITISSAGNEGIFYGIQTLLQLLPPISLNANSQASINANHTFLIPQLSINDYPRFGYRGMHLDVGRHFFDVNFIKKYLDYMAYMKFNNFHFHLTEDQGWRIEIKRYPRLTSVGGFRNGTIIGRYPGVGNDSIRYGGFYTQAQIKEIVKYAADRFINVIPEIEMPGHASAAIAAYPELSCFPDEATFIAPTTPWAGSRDGKQVQQTWGVFDDVFCPSEYTFKFLENVLDEVMQLFPSKYIHIGGDESPKTEWIRSAFCQQLIKDKGLTDEHGLQSYFIQRIEDYLNSKGRKIIGWDEILEGGLAANATVMSWRGEEGGIAAARQKHDVIMTPGTYVYFDHSQSKNEDSVTIGGYLPLDSTYNYEPIPKELNADEAKYVLGAQGNVWTEYIKNSQKVEYMIFPRMSALSEVLWSPKKNRDWTKFTSSIEDIFKRYHQWKANYSTAYYDLQSTLLPTPEFNGVYLKLESKFPNSVIKYKIGDTSQVWKTYDTILFVNSAEKIESYLEVNSIKSSVQTKNFLFNKATGKKITINEQPAPNYPGNGAFTLVDGIITTKGLSQSSDWLGFLGKDMDADIDFGVPTNIQNVSVNTLDQSGSWIYLPKEIDIAVSDDGITYTPLTTKVLDPIKDKGARKITLPAKVTTRYLKVVAKNSGIIPANLPGAGSPAWLMVDEIEVN